MPDMKGLLLQLVMVALRVPPEKNPLPILLPQTDLHAKIVQVTKRALRAQILVLLVQILTSSEATWIHDQVTEAAIVFVTLDISRYQRQTKRLNAKHVKGENFRQNQPNYVVIALKANSKH